MGGIRVGTTRWIDSICYYTMVGECYYQMGQHQQALAQYTSALQLYLSYSNWMMRLTLNAASVRPANPGEFKPIPWGRSTRNFVLGRFPETIPIAGGTVMMGNVQQFKPSGSSWRHPHDHDDLSGQRA